MVTIFKALSGQGIVIVALLLLFTSFCAVFLAFTLSILLLTMAMVVCTSCDRSKLKILS